ncbi:DUF2190 family protein [Shimia thalassica]|uniref:DUF2190 family protein n=1 Tax=Shimia thalassica TaxID=1715693 RepID=UPI001C0A20F9|nr:capsid cement protein [Shimia thalassica]MBU2941065.1 DUF2190 family protein [Shimia thalassica]MDO6504208.1 DUF2190 family protein [Shimia thalassica]
MKNFVQKGDTITVTADADTESGQGVKKGVLFGVATKAAKTGEDLPLKTTGCVELPKISAQDWSAGAAVYWDDANSECTTATTAGNLLIGCAAASAANPSDDGVVRLNGAVPAAVTA